MSAYEDFLDELQERQTRENQLTFSLAEAATTHPDQFARMRALSKAAGIAMDAVPDFKEEAEQAAYLKNVDVRRLWRDAPVSARFLSHPDNAKLAHDDVENLSAIEEAIGFLSNTARAFATLVPTVNEGLWGAGRAGAEFLAPLLDPLTGRILPENPLRRAAAGFADMQQRQRAAAERWMPQSDNLLESAWYSGMRSLGTSLAMLPVAIGTGNPSAMLWGMGMTTGGQAYGEARDKGVGVLPSLSYAASQGVIEAGTERLGLPALFSILKPGQLPRKALEYLIKEQGGEQLATILQDMNEWAVLHPEKSFDDYLKERPNAALQTALATLFAGGGQVAVMKGVEVMARRGQASVEHAEVTAQLLKNLHELAAADKVLARDPETFESFIASASENGPVSHIYIDARTLMQSGLAEQVAAASPAAAEQIPEAAQIGGQIAIPVEEYATRIAPNEYAQGLLDHIKVIPEEQSRAEAQEWQQNHGEELKAEIERAVIEKIGDEAFKASQESVKQAILADMNAVGRFHPDANEGYATLYATYYAVRSAQMGVMPEALYQRRKIHFAAEGMAGAGLNQALKRALPKGWRNGSGKVAAAMWRGHEKKANAIRLEVKAAKLAQEIPGSEGYSHSVSQDALTHIRKNHGDATAEENRGQIAINAGDIEAIPAIVEHYDGIRTDLVSRRGNPVVAYSKRVSDGVILYLEELGKKRRDFAALSMWKYPAAIDVQSVLQRAVADPNVQGDGGRRLNLTDDDGEFNQSQDAPRGRFNPESLTVTLLKGADWSTTLHEGAHFFFENDLFLASELVADARIHGFDALSPGEQQVLKDVSTLFTQHGIQGDIERQLAQWGVMSFEERRAYHEATAEWFENYLFEGQAPSFELASYFQRFAAWMKRVYHSVREFLEKNPNAGKLDDEVRGVFDRMLASTEQIQLAEQGRSLMPLFANVEQSGMSLEGYAAYQAQHTDATNAAIADLQAKGLRDMKWMDRARGKALKRLQREARTLRAKATIKARQEIMTQPVYRAWKFLTGKLSDDSRIGTPKPAKSDPNVVDETRDSLFEAIAKLGGIDRDEAMSTWGLDPEEKPESHLFGKPVLRAQGGLSIDGMTEALSQYGYLTPDEYGKVTPRELEEKFDEELRGNTQYSNAYAPEPPMRAGDQVLHPENLPAGRLDLGTLEAMYGTSQYAPRRSAANFKEAREAAAKFVGQDKSILRNTATGMEARVSRNNLDKMLSESAVGKSASPAVHSLAVANLDQLFENARIGETAPDRQGDDNIQAIHRFYSPLVTHEAVYRVKLTVKEFARETSKIYSVEAVEIENAAPSMNPAGPGGVGGQENLPRPPGSGVDPSIISWLEKVKEDHENGAMIVGVLRSRRMTARKGGIHPDIVADLILDENDTPLFSSGDQMVRELAAAIPPKEAIEALTQQILLARHGELATPEAVERAADQAIHNEVRAKFVTTEANALAKAVGKAGVLLSAAKEYAAAAIGRKRVRDLTPGQYARAEVRAAKATEKAFQTGDLATAATEKRNQVIQQQLTRATYDALEEVEKGLRYLKRFNKPVKGLDADYAGQIHDLLERFDLRDLSLKKIDKTSSLADWLNKQRAVGFEPNIPKELEIESFRTSYKNLTMEEFRALVDSVKEIDHFGRLKNRLLTAARNRDFAAVVKEIAESIYANAKHIHTGPIFSPENMGPADRIRLAYNWHKRAYAIAAMLDGQLSGGPVWEYLVRTANAAGNRETTMVADYTEKLLAIIKPLGRFDKKRTHSETLNRVFTGSERFALALNVGNAGNIQRLQDGNGWSLAAVKAELQKLPAAQLRAVQQVWDLMETLRPHLAEQEKRLYGQEPEWVEAQPITLVSAEGEVLTLRGGYFPIKYDPDASGGAGNLDAVEEAKKQLAGAHGSAGSRPGSMKKRVDELKGHPVLISNATMYTAIEDSIHYLAWQEWMVDANRLLRNDEIQEAIRRTQGPETLKQLQEFVRGNGDGNRRLNDAANRLFTSMRRHVSAAGLALNVVSAAIQPMGLGQSCVAIGTKWVGQGIAAFAADRSKMTGAVNALSPFMANRARTMHRELNEVRNTIAGQGVGRQWMERYGYFLMPTMQKLADYPTWWGMYHKALDEGRDNDTAVAMADQAVIATQGSGMIKDLSALERSKFGKLFTVFYNFMGTNLNLGMISAKTAKTRGETAAKLLVLFALLPAIEQVLREALSIGDDDDDETLWRKLAANQLSFLFGSFVGLREFQNVSRILQNGRANYEGPAGLRVFSDAYKWSEQAAQGEFDLAFFRASINLIGVITGLPAAQINRTASGIVALAEDETDNPAALVLGYRGR